jgi:hypothetical protein
VSQIDVESALRRAWNRKMLDTGYTPYLETRRWRRLAIASTTIAAIQAVVIAVVLIGRWLALG